MSCNHPTFRDLKKLIESRASSTPGTGDPMLHLYSSLLTEPSA